MSVATLTENEKGADGKENANSDNLPAAKRQKIEKENSSKEQERPNTESCSKPVPLSARRRQARIVPRKEEVLDGERAEVSNNTNPSIATSTQPNDHISANPQPPPPLHKGQPSPQSFVHIISPNAKLPSIPLHTLSPLSHTPLSTTLQSAIPHPTPIPNTPLFTTLPSSLPPPVTSTIIPLVIPMPKIPPSPLIHRTPLTPQSPLKTTTLPSPTNPTVINTSPHQPIGSLNTLTQFSGFPTTHRNTFGSPSHTLFSPFSATPIRAIPIPTANAPSLSNPISFSPLSYQKAPASPAFPISPSFPISPTSSIPFELSTVDEDDCSSMTRSDDDAGTVDVADPDWMAPGSSVDWEAASSKTYTSSYSKSALQQHLRGVAQRRKNRKEHKLNTEAIAAQIQRAEYICFVQEAFLSFQAFQGEDKESKKKAAELKKRKCVFENYQEEIRMLMHAAGDVSESMLESAKFLELLMKKYLASLVKEVRSVLPKEIKDSKVNADILLVTMLPDIKRVLRLRQAIELLLQSRRLKHTEESASSSSESGEFEKLSVETLEDISCDAQVAPPTIKSESKQKEKESIFDDPIWQEPLRAAAVSVEDERRARYLYKDELAKRISRDGFAFWSQCSVVSFTKPNRRKFTEFLQNHCGLGDMQLTGKVAEMMGLLAYDFLMEVILGALKKKEELKKDVKKGAKGPLEPIHIASFIEGKAKQVKK